MEEKRASPCHSLFFQSQPYQSRWFIITLYLNFNYNKNCLLSRKDM